MAIPKVIFKTSQIIAFAVGLSISPKGVTHAKKWILDAFDAPPSAKVKDQASSNSNSQGVILEPATLPPEKPAPVAPAPQPVVKILQERGYKGCQVLNGIRDRTIWWYVCSDKDQTNKVAFFNYKRTRTPADSKIKKVTRIKNTQITYEAGESENLLRYPFFWMGGSKSVDDFAPTTDCKFTKKQEGNNYFSLSCKEKDVQNVYLD